MDPYVLVAAPAGGLWRVAHRRHLTFGFPPPPAALEWSEAHAPVHPGGRWDDPDGVFQTLYCAATPTGALMEALRPLRRPPERLLRTTAANRDINAVRGRVPSCFLPDRLIGQAMTYSQAMFIDVADPHTHNGLPEHVRRVLSWFGVRDVDRSTVLSDDRRVTRYLARHFFEACQHDELTHVRGLRFESRIAPKIECFAVWNEPSPIDLDTITTTGIDPTDPAVIDAVAALGLTVITAPPTT